MEDDDYSSEDEFTEIKKFVTYKCESVGRPHPGSKVVESVTLAYATPPPLKYVVRNSKVEMGLSFLQLDTCRRIMDTHELFNADGTRTGFFLGDGTGIGKGRQIAATIILNFDMGRKKALWISTSNSLVKTANDDFDALGVKTYSQNFQPPVNPLNRLIDSKLKNYQGVVFATYSGLTCKGGSGKLDPFEKLHLYLGGDFDGVIALDECHKAKSFNDLNEASSKTSKAIVHLQEQYPKARVIYASATGATEVKHLTYMTRLGLWGPNTRFFSAAEFMNAMQRRGPVALEILAIQLKSKGLYVSRQISLKHVTFSFKLCSLTDVWRQIYEQSVVLFQFIIEFLKMLRKKRNGVNGTAFWSSQQRYFAAICTASKVDKTVRLARMYVEDRHMSVVIGLQHTGEAASKDHNGYSLKKYLKDCIQSLGLKAKKKDGNIVLRARRSRIENDYEKAVELLSCISDVYNALLLKVGLVKNVLDELIERLGGTTRVAELTGRVSRMVAGKMQGRRNPRGVIYETVNNIERDLFQSDRKRYAIISDAASTGLSLHAECVQSNQSVKKRVHLTIELPWSADKVVQQLGRTHRSNQSHAPDYVFLFTDVPAECRFVTTLSNRIKNLGAIANGDRKMNAIELTHPEEFGAEIKYSTQALLRLYEWCKEKVEIETHVSRHYVIRQLLKAGIFQKRTAGDLYVSPKLKTVEKFLNRLFMINLQGQKKILNVLSEIILDIVETDKRNGIYDEGIREFIPKKHTSLILNEKRMFTLKNGKVELISLIWDRGMKLSAMTKYRENSPSRVSFLIGSGNAIVMRVRLNSETDGQFVNVKYDLYSPVSGKLGTFDGADIKYMGYKSESIPNIDGLWKEQYEGNYVCKHKYRGTTCPSKYCQSGARCKYYTVLSGDVLDIWERLSELCHRKVHRVVRVNMGLTGTAIGIEIPQDRASYVENFLLECVTK